MWKQRAIWRNGWSGFSRCEVRQSAVSKSKPIRFLFVGNSFTARNDLPDLIAQLASARGVRMEHALLSIGGASLRTHWNKGEARTAHRERSIRLRGAAGAEHASDQERLSHARECAAV